MHTASPEDPPHGDDLSIAAVDALIAEHESDAAEVLSPVSLEGFERERAAHRKARARLDRASRRETCERVAAHPEGAAGLLRELADAHHGGRAGFLAESARMAERDDRADAHRRRCEKRTRRTAARRLGRCEARRRAPARRGVRGRRTGASSQTAGADPPPGDSDPEPPSPPWPPAGRHPCRGEATRGPQVEVLR